MIKLSLAAVMIAVVGGGAGARGSATEHMVTIGDANVTTYGPASVESGKYYKLDFYVPQVGSATMLETALLEFYVDAESFVRGDFHWLDADSVEHVGYRTRAPLIEVFALKSPIEGGVKEGQLDMTTAARRPISAGPNRRVMIDIAPIVRSFMEDPTRNRGIVIGSFLGSQEGDFTLQDGMFRDGSRAKVRLEFAPNR